MIEEQLTGRGSIRAIRKILAPVEEAIAARLRRKRRVNFVLSVVIGSLTLLSMFLLFATLDEDSVCCILIGVPVAGLVLYLLLSDGGGAAKYAGPRLTQLTQLLDELEPDLHPTKNLSFYIDLTSAESGEKAVRHYESITGKRKVKYVDPWFMGQLHLADRSRVRLQLVEKAKTKSGTRIATDHIATLAVRPSNLYGTWESWDLERLEQLGLDYNERRLKKKIRTMSDPMDEVLSTLGQMTGHLSRVRTRVGGGA